VNKDCMLLVLRVYHSSLLLHHMFLVFVLQSFDTVGWATGSFRFVNKTCLQQSQEALHVAVARFYPRNAMLARIFATATCLSVCLSVTRRYCAQESESRIVKCTPSDSPMILVSGKVWVVEKFARGHPKWTC